MGVCERVCECDPTESGICRTVRGRLWIWERSEWLKGDRALVGSLNVDDASYRLFGYYYCLP